MWESSIRYIEKYAPTTITIAIFMLFMFTFNLNISEY